jgi:hypothetical protein
VNGSEIDDFCLQEFGTRCKFGTGNLLETEQWSKQMRDGGKHGTKGQKANRSNKKLRD